MTPLAAFIVTLPKISVSPLLPITLNLLVLIVKSFVIAAECSVARAPVVILSANATVLTPPPVLVRVMMSVSVEIPMALSVNLTLSTST